MTTQPITTILPLLDQFDAFILDQWGVLHDGIQAFPWALDAVERLLKADKIVLTLSNSGRREVTASAKMRELGLPVERFRANVTSGETAIAALRTGRIGDTRLPGRRCYVICRHGDLSVIEDTGLERVDTPLEADFVLLSGIEGEVRDVESYLDELAPAIDRALPIVATNPDLVAVSPTGNNPAPGSVAEAYAKRTNQRPLYIGKPFAPVYDRCKRALPDVSSARIVAIGDSLDHDIKGGRDAGLATVFCMDGIHKDAFDLDQPARANLAALDALKSRHDDTSPDFLIDRLRWT